MQRLRPRSIGARTILNRFLPYVLARLESHPELAAVTALVQMAHDSLESALWKFWSAQKETMAAASVRDARRYQLDAALRTLRTAILVTTFNDRRSTLYQAVFPDGFSSVIESNPTDELAQARRILQVLDEFPNPDLAPAVDRLQRAGDALAAALTGLHTAVAEEQAASGALATAKQSCCMKYEASYYQLVLALRERRQAETFFRRVRRSEAGQRQSDAEQQVVPRSLEVPDPSSAPVVALVARSGVDADGAFTAEHTPAESTVPRTRCARRLPRRLRRRLMMRRPRLPGPAGSVDPVDARVGKSTTSSAISRVSLGVSGDALSASTLGFETTTNDRRFAPVDSARPTPELSRSRFSRARWWPDWWGMGERSRRSSNSRLSTRCV